MWLKGILLTLAAVLVLGFSLGCEPEQEMDAPEGFEEEAPPAPEGYEPPAPEGYEPPAPEGYEQPEGQDPYGEPGEE
ncbi:hypothetical protein [Desulfonatronospira sp.]|uniref:hypothetical protein n=1 Tax=Desulfonatronospira sp. TaxID=1962951 RepID=UPI0025C4EFC9|nr:hypothetical protein [Desulfonatronospira sp.]